MEEEEEEENRAKEVEERWNEGDVGARYDCFSVILYWINGAETIERAITRGWAAGTGADERVGFSVWQCRWASTPCKALRARVETRQKGW